MTELEIFINAPEGLSGQELASYFDQACDGDEALRARVEALCESHRQAPSFMEYARLQEAADAVDLEGPGTVIGNYKLLQEIGIGGFGVVYMAEQLAPVKRRVAFKIIKLGMDTKQVVARFEAERQALAMMEHPNIAKVFDAGATQAGRPFFVMELVRGIPITKFCDEQRLNIDARLDLFIAVCSAVQHAHQKGIIHRDLKPSNVLVTMHDDKAVPKVIDFGIAKATQAELTDKTLFTRFEQFIGTPTYMSPEQAQLSGLDIDTRSDIYGLGVLLYELLTGTTPFDAETLRCAGHDEMRRMIREQEPPKPSTRMRTATQAGGAHPADRSQLGALRGDLDWIVMKAMEKDRARRYPSANELALDIQRHLADEPVTAAAPGAVYRIRKYVKRHRAALSVTAALAVIALFSAWMAVVARSALSGEAEVRASAQAQERLGRHQLAEEFFAAGKSDLAVAHLVNLVREDPADRVAVERLVSALVYRDFLELIAPMDGPDLSGRRIAGVAQFIDEDTVLAPVPAAGRVCVWDKNTGVSRWVTPRGGGYENGRIAISPDRTKLAVQRKNEGDPSHDLFVYDLATNEPIHQLRYEPGSVAWAMAFSGDGNKLLVGELSGMARIWDLEAGTQLVYREHAGNHDILAAAITRDGSLAITCGAETHLWDTATGKRRATLPHGARVWTVALSPDGRYAATASGDHTAQVWSAATGERLGKPLQHEGRVNQVVFSPDSRLVATASADNTAMIWDAASGELFVPPLRHNDNVLWAEFDRSGRHLLTSSLSGDVPVWEVGTGRQIGSPFKPSDTASNARFSPSGDSVLAISLDAGAELWKTPRQRPTGHILRHRNRHDWRFFGGKVSCAKFSADGSKIVSATRYEAVRLWDARSGVPLGSAFGPGNDPGYGAWAALSPDGHTLVTTSRGGAAALWNLGGSSPERHPLEVGKPWYTEFSKDGEAFLISGKGQPTRVFRVGTGTGDFVGQALGTEASYARADSMTRAYWAHFSPESKRVIAPSGLRSVRVWNLESMMPHPKLAHNGIIESTAFHPDRASNLVVLGSRDGAVQVWNSKNGEQIFDVPLKHAEAVKFVQFSPDGQLIASASADGTARLWDATTGAPVRTLRHESTVAMVIFSPDGARVATASYDRTARVWDTATGLPISEALRHDGWVYSVDFHPDGRRLVTTGFDGTAKIWDIPEVPLPAPGWFLQWAESVGGKRIDKGGIPSAVDWQAVVKMREEVAGVSGDGFYARLVQWHRGEVDSRTITPFSDVTLAQYVDLELAANTPESLEEAVRVDPENSVALGRLSLHLYKRSEQFDPASLRRAVFYAHQALSCDPGNQQAQEVLEKILQLDGAEVEAAAGLPTGASVEPVGKAIPSTENSQR